MDVITRKQLVEKYRDGYRMVLEAYWKGDSAALRPFVDDHVFETFNSAIEQREKDGLVLDNKNCGLMLLVHFRGLAGVVVRTKKSGSSV